MPGQLCKVAECYELYLQALKAECTCSLWCAIDRVAHL